MILAAAAPGYIPGTAYFYKMAQADLFVIADDIRYSVSSHINRNSIGNVVNSQPLTVPVLTSKKGIQQIKDVQIDQQHNWRQKHWKSIYANYKYAPYFQYYSDFFEQLYQKKWQYLIDLNMTIIKFLCQALNISCRQVLRSNLAVQAAGTAGIIETVQQVNAATYVTWKKDKTFLEENLFIINQIKLDYIEFTHPVYRQQFEPFQPNLSIIDLLFNYGPMAQQLIPPKK